MITIPDDVDTSSMSIPGQDPMMSYAGPADILPPGEPTPISSPVSNPAASVMYASMGLSAIGAITNAFSQSAAVRAQGNYESSIASTNAAIAGLQERQTLEQGDIEASRQNLKTQASVGSEKAAEGASGVDVASGSAAIVRAGTTSVGQIDELTIRNNAARKAWGYQTEELQDNFQGQFAQLTAKAKSFQGLLSGGLQAISGPLGIESNYLRFSRYMGGGGGNGLPFPNAS